MARPNAEKNPQQLAKAKWRSSGISDQTAKRLRFKALDAQQVKQTASKFHEAAALRIPYFDLLGKPTKFFRIRYLSKLPGPAGMIEKPQRYDQLPVTPEVYYPPLLKQTWKEISDDASVSVVVTEGELKAACSCQRGIPTIGLGGVHSFMSSKKGVDLLPSMEDWNWEARLVYVVFDNDITHKLPVMRAQRDLAKTLLARGAKVMFVTLPPGPEKGLDDFLVKHGREKLFDLIDKAQEFEECAALWAMNEEIVYIRPPSGIVVERESGIRMDVGDFKQHAYANRFYMERIIKGSGKTERMVLEKAPLAAKWLEWEHRAELDNITYQPGSGQITCSKCTPLATAHEHDQSWNTWPGWGVVPKKGDVGPWHWLLDFLFKGEDKARAYFEKWCAYPIQHPGAKMYTAVVLWSRVKRLGKSMAFLALSRIYGENATFVNSKQLKGSFNTWAKDRQLVIGEEITAGEARIDADYMKDIITNPFFTINTKFMPEYVIPNHTNFGFLSNHPDAVFLEDGDMRYLIHAVLQEKPAAREMYEKADKWLHGTGPAALMHYFLDMNLRNFNPREHAPETKSKFQMIVAGKTDTGLWVMKLLEDTRHALKALGEKAAEGCDLFTPDQLYRAYDPEGRARGRSSVASMGKALVAAGVRQVNGGTPVVTNTGAHRLCAVRNQVKWDMATRKEIREHYEQFFGPKMAGSVK